MTNWGAHHLDIAQWGLGMDESGPVEIEGKRRVRSARSASRRRSSSPSPTNTPTASVIECRCPGADAADYSGGKSDRRWKSWMARSDFTGCIFEGEKGLLYVNRGVIRVWPDRFSRNRSRTPTRASTPARSTTRTGSSASRAASCPSATWPSGIARATVCHLGNIAIRSGKKVQWDPLQERIIGDPETALMVSRPYRAPWKLPEG